VPIWSRVRGSDSAATCGLSSADVRAAAESGYSVSERCRGPHAGRAGGWPNVVLPRVRESADSYGGAGRTMNIPISVSWEMSEPVSAIWPRSPVVM
jgi:hypothetical protein